MTIKFLIKRTKNSTIEEFNFFLNRDEDYIFISHRQDRIKVPSFAELERKNKGLADIVKSEPLWLLVFCIPLIYANNDSPVIYQHQDSNNQLHQISAEKHPDGTFTFTLLSSATHDFHTLKQVKYSGLNRNTISVESDNYKLTLDVQDTSIEVLIDKAIENCPISFSGGVALTSTVSSILLWSLLGIGVGVFSFSNPVGLTIATVVSIIAVIAFNSYLHNNCLKPNLPESPSFFSIRSSTDAILEDQVDEQLTKRRGYTVT